MTFFLITGSDLQVAARRMTTTVQLLRAPSLGAGSPPLVGHVRGKRMLPRGALAPGGPTTRGLELGAELLLALCVRAEGQPPALPAPGFGPLRAPRTGLTGTGRQLGVLAWAQRPGLGVGTGDRAVLAGQRAGVLGHQRPAWRPGAGQAGPPWRAIHMKLSINSRRKFNGFMLLAQAFPQYLCGGLSFA